MKKTIALLLALAAAGAAMAQSPDSRFSYNQPEVIMDLRHLGDSYDILKRFWHTELSPIAELYADSSFVPGCIQADYQNLTLIPVRAVRDIPRPFGILLDPDTGIRLPDTDTGNERSHVSLDDIIKLSREFGPEYVISFDQSFRRDKDRLSM